MTIYISNHPTNKKITFRTLIASQLSQPPVIYRTFLFSENHVAVSLYISSYGSVKCRTLSRQAGDRWFESLRFRNKKSFKNAGFLVTSLIIFNHIYSFIPKMETHFGGTYPSPFPTIHLGLLLHMAARSA